MSMTVKFKNKTTVDFIKNYIDDLEYKEYWLGSESNSEYVYTILINKTVVGFIEFDVNIHRNGRRFANLSMIEILKTFRRKHLSQVILLQLFNQFKLSTIYGESFSKTIEFWKDSGADFEMSESKLQEYIKNGYSAVFKLIKSNFKLSENYKSAWRNWQTR